MAYVNQKSPLEEGSEMIDSLLGLQKKKIPCKRKRSGSKFNDGEIDSVLLLKAKYQAERDNVKTAMKETNNWRIT